MCVFARADSEQFMRMNAPSWLWLSGRVLWSRLLAGLNDSLWGSFVCPWIAGKTQGVVTIRGWSRYWTETRAKADFWQRFTPKKSLKQQSSDLISQNVVVGGRARIAFCRLLSKLTPLRLPVWPGCFALSIKLKTMACAPSAENQACSPLNL